MDGAEVAVLLRMNRLLETLDDESQVTGRGFQLGLALLGPDVVLAAAATGSPFVTPTGSSTWDTPCESLRRRLGVGEAVSDNPEAFPDTPL
jgi:hypothetical protein